MSTTKKQPHFYLQPISAACFILIALTTTNLSAAPLALSQKPAGNGSSEPAPNVIITVDDSGSMNDPVNGGTISTTNPSKMTSLKAALNAQFIDGGGKVPDNRIRLAWQAMHNNGGATDAGTLLAGKTNAIRPFSGTHKTNFADFITSLTPNNGTPSHDMMLKVYNYMKTAPGDNSPWANNPGTAQSTSTYLACRRSYHIFMTDGAWNSEDNSVHNIGNQDGTSISAFPVSDPSLNIPASTPTSYTPFTAQTKVYSDTWGGETKTTQNCGRRGCTTTTNTYASTLADFAFRSWAEDLQPNIDNKIKPLMRVENDEVVGATTLQPFWNPKNDPATWQHVTQHTIGFGTGATAWSGAPVWDAPNATTGNIGDNNYGGTGDYSKLVNGTVTWQEPVIAANARESELWHMALNGRGKFYPSRDATSLTKAFSDILDNILADTTKPLVSIAANGTRLKTGLYAYQAGYDGNNWAGRLLAYPINSTTAVIGTTPAWSVTGRGAPDANGTLVVNDPGMLDDPNYSVTNRFVASYNGTSGIEWKTYSSLPSEHQLPLSKNSTGTVDHTTTNNYGQKRVDYLRGDRTKEASQTGGIFRNRGSRLGDIVNSNIVYVGAPNSRYSESDYATFIGSTANGVGSRTPMVYVGANDGMLHGFDATNGVEKLAYIPQGIAQGDLRKLTDTTYTHQYFVDGTPFTSDAKVGTLTASPTWKTVLVSGLGGGGKGYVALDASNPADFTATTTNLAKLVIADTTFSNSVTALPSATASATTITATTYDPNVGNMFITPAMDDYIAGKSDQIVRLNAPTTGTTPNEIKHRWALVLGNGYNSTNEAPVLMIQYLDGAREIKNISPCISTTTNVFDTSCAYKTGNGLSTPRLVDLDGDGVADVAYAGDLSGNVWKFDLSSTDNTKWTTSFGQKPLFIAKPGQSFTTAPYVVSNDVAGYGHMVHISSGKNLTTADQSSTDTETTYALWDSSKFGQVEVQPVTSPPTYKFQVTDSTPINTISTIPSSMVKQTLNATTFVNNGSTYYTQTSSAVDYKGTTPKRGWYMDWIVRGQRVLRNSKSFDGQQISIYSVVPSSTTGTSNAESCTVSLTGERNFLTTINLFTGNPAKKPVYDVPTANAPFTTTVEVPPGDPLELTTADGKGSKYVTACPEGQVCSGGGGGGINRTFGSYVGARANWREKQ